MFSRPFLFSHNSLKKQKCINHFQFIESFINNAILRHSISRTRRLCRCLCTFANSQDWYRYSGKNIVEIILKTIAIEIIDKERKPLLLGCYGGA